VTVSAADRAAFLRAARGAARQVVALSGAGSVIDHHERSGLEALGAEALGTAVEATGFGMPADLRVLVMDRTQWLEAALDDMLPYFLDMLDSLSGDETPENPRVLEESRKIDPSGPAGVLGVGIGLTIGQLAKRALGTYELAVPRPNHDDRLLVLPENLAVFAREWEIPLNEVQAWACTTDALVHLVITRAHVRRRLTTLLRAYMTNVGLDSEALAAAMAGRVKGKIDPDALMASLETPAQQRPAAELRAISTTLAAHAMRIAEAGLGVMAPISPRLAEAVRRRRGEMPLRDRLAEFWFGLTLGPAQQRRGERFLARLSERGGERAMRRLWTTEESIPQPEDIEDPERWLARVA